MTLPKYDMLIVDPPWEHKDDKKDNKPHLGGLTYPVMTLQDICDLPIRNMATKDCLLFCWATSPHFEHIGKVMKCWGWKYRTVVHVWIKLNPTGEVVQEGRDIILKNGVFSGLGSYSCGNAEYLCVGRRSSKPLNRIDCTQKQVIFAPVGKSSAKPREAQDRIVRAYGERYRAELFAREAYAGWDAFGDEIDGRDIRDVLKEYA